MYSIEYIDQSEIKHINVKSDNLIEACQKFTKEFPNCEILRAVKTALCCNCTTFTDCPTFDSTIHKFVCPNCTEPINHN